MGRLASESTPQRARALATSALWEPPMRPNGPNAAWSPVSTTSSTKAGKVALVTRAGIALVDPATLPLDVRDERDEFSEVRMK